MKYELWLSNISGIGPVKIRHLLQHFGSAEAVYFAKDTDYGSVFGLSDKDVHSMEQSKKEWDVEAELFRLQEMGIGFVTENDPDYPEKLHNIVNPPYSIYYKGKLPEPKKRSAAIVGARGCSSYGRDIATLIAKELAARDVEIISGLARGIDADGHRGALSAGGATYGILGCGVNVIYPRENKYLFERLLEKGGILSEYPVDMQAEARFFPSRNRIISALSDFTVVIEARLRSGSLITADCAMEQGKDVYALPGRITDPLSAGCNRLIKQGAQPILSIDDFLKDVLLLEDGICSGNDFKKNILEKEELLVYSLLDFCPVSIGTLLEKTSFSLIELINILNGLEQKSFIREIQPNYFVLRTESKL